MAFPGRVLNLPGWQNSGPDHWQTRWETQHGFERVQQHDRDWPRRGDWMAQLDAVVQSDPGPTALVAHSLGCQLVAAWAAHSGHTQHITAALLVAPADTERADTPPQLSTWRHIVRQRLPFPAIMVYSSNDPYCDASRARQTADNWGACDVNLGDTGHINADIALGDWPAGLTWLGACRALGRAPVEAAKGCRLGAKRSDTRRYRGHFQRRMHPFAASTRRAGVICGASRRCQLVVWPGHTPRWRLDRHRNSPRRGPDPKPDRLLDRAIAACV